MIRTHWTYTGCDETQQRQLAEAWKRRESALESKLAILTDEPSEVRVAVEHETDKWAVQASLSMPACTLVAESSADTAEPALDEVARQLSAKAERQEELATPAAARRQGSEAILPFLTRYRGQGQGQAQPFMSFLSPLIRSLGSYVERELRVRQVEGTLPSPKPTADDVLDEVLVRAWDGFDSRPGSMPPDVWLMKLADEVLDQKSAQPAAESLEERREAPAPDPREAEETSWTEQATYPETVELVELLPGQPRTGAWDDLDMETKRRGITGLLSGVPRQQRQALILNAVEGFSLAEVADFQGRSEDEVIADLVAARQAIEHRLREEDLPEVEEDLMQEAVRDIRRRKT